MAKNRTLRERLSTATAAISAGLIDLVREMVPVVLFFFVAFFLIFFIFKLLSPKYSIDFSAFTKAAVAALILGKVALLLNMARGSRVGHSSHVLRTGAYQRARSCSAYARTQAW